MLPRPRRLILVALAVALLVNSARADQPTAVGALILHSNQRPTPAASVIEDTLRTVVPSAAQRPVELYSEYLDDEWASVKTYGAAEADFLEHKYGRRNIRAIVTSAAPALQFATEFRDQIPAPERDQVMQKIMEASGSNQ